MNQMTVSHRLGASLDPSNRSLYYFFFLRETAFNSFIIYSYMRQHYIQCTSESCDVSVHREHDGSDGGNQSSAGHWPERWWAAGPLMLTLTLGLHWSQGSTLGTHKHLNIILCINIIIVVVVLSCTPFCPDKNRKWGRGRSRLKKMETAHIKMLMPS